MIIGALAAISLRAVPAVSDADVSAAEISPAWLGFPSPSQADATKAYQQRGEIAGAPLPGQDPERVEWDLLVFAPGYRDNPEGGETDRQTLPPPTPIAPDLTIAGDGTMEELLLAEGYGLAGTRYPATTGCRARRRGRHSQPCPLCARRRRQGAGRLGRRVTSPTHRRRMLARCCRRRPHP